MHKCQLQGRGDHGSWNPAQLQTCARRTDAARILGNMMMALPGCNDISNTRQVSHWGESLLLNSSSHRHFMDIHD